MTNLPGPSRYLPILNFILALAALCIAVAVWITTPQKTSASFFLTTVTAYMNALTETLNERDPSFGERFATNFNKEISSK